MLTPSPPCFRHEETEAQRREVSGPRSLHGWGAALGQDHICSWCPVQCSFPASGQLLGIPPGLWRPLGFSLASLWASCTHSVPYLSHCTWRFDWPLQYYSPSPLATDIRRRWFWKTRHQARSRTEQKGKGKVRNGQASLRTPFQWAENPKYSQEINPHCII